MNVESALIGYSGFVGSNLDQQAPFMARYNSSNIEQIAGRTFDLLICAGAPAQKWIANKEPERDKANIARLISALEGVRAERVVLISTIDVYPDPSRPYDESTVLDRAANHAYGRHRLELEDWMRRHFPKAVIVRLPALFGPGLKKNVLYDLLHDNQTELINPASVFQWYPVTSLWSDILRAEAAGLKLVNLFPEPLGMDSIIESFFRDTKVGPRKQPAPSYCLQTLHADTFGGRGRYIMQAHECLNAIGEFVAAERRL